MPASCFSCIPSTLLLLQTTPSLPILTRFPPSSQHHFPSQFCRQSQLRAARVEPRRRRCLCIGSIATDADRESAGVVVPRSVPVRVAHELLQAGHRFLDVRTPEEFDEGHAERAVNVPYMFKFGLGITKNPNFVEEVSAIFGNDAEILVGCQSGKRSLMAATDLSLAGFTGITDVAGGYSTWMRNGLPTQNC